MERQLHLIECDLRWGVPKDSTTAAVLCTCMEEIKRCHGDSDGQGMFLNLLGERCSINLAFYININYLNELTFTSNFYKLRLENCVFSFYSRALCNTVGMVCI